MNQDAIRQLAEKHGFYDVYPTKDAYKKAIAAITEAVALTRAEVAQELEDFDKTSNTLKVLADRIRALEGKQ